MNLKEKFLSADDFKTLVEAFDLSNYSFNKVLFNKGTNAIYYVRENKDREDWLLILFNYTCEYLYFLHNHAYWITFKSLNKVLTISQISKINTLWEDNYSYRNKALCKSHPQFSVHPFKIDRINLLNSKAEFNLQLIDLIAKEFKKYFENHILPFYNLFPSLQMINDEIINKGLAADYISGMYGFKQMAIMKLCNNPDYQNYISEYETRLKKGVEMDQSKYQPYLDFFYRLQAQLENYISDDM